MRFRIEYYDAGAKAWKAAGAGGNSGWRRVGKGRRTVETGYTFTFKPPSAGRTLELRGQVDFAWRAGSRTLASSHGRTLTGFAAPGDPNRADSRDSCIIRR